MKKSPLLLLSLLVVLSGCFPKKEKKEKVVKRKKKTELATNVDIPLASDEVESYFDSKGDVNLGEFVLVEDAQVQENDDEADVNENIDSSVDVAENEINLNNSNDLDDFSWIQEVKDEDEKFEKCHFAFNSYDVKEDQEKNIKDNIALAKNIIDEGGELTIVIEGHACHSAGSATYNMMLSEQRAKVVSDRFVSAGIPADKIKIVSRGQECPVKDDEGNDITGDKNAQWANRRSEVKVIYS